MLLSCCLLAGLTLGQANATDTTGQSATIRALVAQLDAPQKSQRDTAEQQLIELGPGVSGMLPPDDDRLSAEVRLRLDRVRAQFDRARTTASTQASKITLEGKDILLSDALAAVEKQTGNHLVDDRKHFGQTPGTIKLNLDLKRTPFWPALDGMLDQAGMTTYASGEPGLSLVSRSDAQLPRSGRACYAGAFRIEPLGLAALRDLRNPTQNVLQLRLEASWEPRLRPIVLYAPNATVQAVDEHGANLTLANPASQLELNVNSGMYQMTFPIDFALPPRSVERIASLKGQLRAVLPGPVDEFRFDRLDDFHRRVERRAGVSVALDEVRKEQSLWEVRIRVTFDNPGTALESHRNWILDNEAWLESPKKERVAYGRLEPTRQSDSEVGLSFLFAVPDLAGYTFVYRTPAAISTVPVEWELKDLKLP